VRDAAIAAVLLQVPSHHTQTGLPVPPSDGVPEASIDLDRIEHPPTAAKQDF
jgi:hypothetical protein